MGESWGYVADTCIWWNLHQNKHDLLIVISMFQYSMAIFCQVPKSQFLIDCCFHQHTMNEPKSDIFKNLCQTNVHLMWNVWLK